MSYIENNSSGVQVRVYADTTPITGTLANTATTVVANATVAQCWAAIVAAINTAAAAVPTGNSGPTSYEDIGQRANELQACFADLDNNPGGVGVVNT